jgi:hypothetical protein
MECIKLKSTMKNLIFLFFPFSLYAQTHKTINTSNSVPVDISGKQATLISGSNIKTINGQPIIGSGNLSVTASAVPEANFYGSSYGNDANTGTDKTIPKGTLRALDTAINASNLTGVTVALEGGSIFKGTDGIVLNRGAVNFTAYNRNKARKFSFPMMIGTDVHNNGWTATGTNSYQKNITHTITLSYGSYAYIYVIEIDTALEKILPLTARRYLSYKTNTTAVDTVAGTYYCPFSASAVTPALITIHTSDNANPNNHPKFRYEVVVRDRAINRTLNTSIYGQALSVEKLFAMDYGQGTGPIASRADSFYMYRCVLMGNAIHQASIGNYSTIDKCGFIGGDGNINGTSVVFYQTLGANETNTLQNSIFLDQPSVLYTHTGTGGSNHGKLVFKNSYVFNNTRDVISSANCDTLDVDGIYADSAYWVVNNSDARHIVVKNSIFRRATTLLIQGTNAYFDNCFFKSKEYSSLSIAFNPANCKTYLTNSIFHIKNRKSIGNESGVIFNNSGVTSKTVAKYNIFIAEAPSDGFIRLGQWVTGRGDDFDYNAYILVSGSVTWFANGSYVLNFATWKSTTGMDSHSIFIDLTASKDLKKIFVDPDNGNYSFSDTPQADSVKALMAGMRTPLKRFVNTPTREQILDTYENDNFVSPAKLLEY